VTPYVGNVGVPVAASPNAAFGRLIKEHVKDLRPVALAEEPTIDSEAGPTTTMRWAKLPR